MTRSFSWSLLALILAPSDGLLAQTHWIRGRVLEPALASRRQHSMAYDQAAEQTVLFGGRDSGGTWYRETWLYDGLRWQQQSPGTRPTARLNASLTYDPTRGRAVLFGGFAQPTGYHGDTWEWDGNNWSLFAGSGPGARTYHGAVWDTAQQKIVVFGGITTGAFLNDMWVFDGVAWTPFSPVNAPPPGRANHAMTYDTRRQRIVVFGGRIAIGPAGVADTWEFDGATWSNPTPTTSPPAHVGSKMVYHPGRDRCVFLTGTANTSTWEWDGTNWQQITTATEPAGGLENQMVYDPLWQRVVSHGGTGTSQTWHYGTLTPAASNSFGSGCGTGAPFLSSDPAWIGNPGVAINSFSNGSILGLIAVSLAASSTALPGGCTLYVGAPLSLFVVVPTPPGIGTTSISIPADPALRGLLLFAQGAVPDPASALGWALSPGLRLTIGD